MLHAIGPVDTLHADRGVIEASEPVDVQIEFAGDISASQEGGEIAIENGKLDAHPRKRRTKIIRRAPEVGARNVSQPERETLAVGLLFIACLVEQPVGRIYIVGID